MRVLLLLLLLSLGMGCSRKDPAPTTTDLISNTQWYGLFTYKGETKQRIFTIRFDYGGGFLWQDLTGDYDGIWNLSETNDRVTITFRANGIQTTFSLLTGNELSNPKNLNHTVWTVAQLRKVEGFTRTDNGPVLSNTQWYGTADQSETSLHFNANQLFTLRPTKDPAGLLGGGTYTVSGRTIRFSKAYLYPSDEVFFFGVFVDDKTLVGHWQFRNSGGSYKDYANQQFSKKL